MNSKVVVSARVGKDLLERLDTLSRKTFRSRSEIIMVAVERYLNEINGDPAHEMGRVKWRDAGLTVREYVFRERVDELFEELSREVKVRDYGRLKNRLRSLYLMRGKVRIDDEIDRKLRFIARRVGELERLRRGKLEEIESKKRETATLKMRYRQEIENLKKRYAEEIEKLDRERKRLDGEYLKFKTEALNAALPPANDVSNSLRIHV